MNRVNHSSVLPAPSCPECNSLMALRIKKVSGESFWGCKRYPKCNFTVPIVSENPPKSKIDYPTSSKLILPVDWG